MAYAINIATKAVGINIGGKHGTVVLCPVCGRPGVKVRSGKKLGVFYTDYAHNLFIGLNRKHEPECTPGDLCRSSDDPSRAGSGGV